MKNNHLNDRPNFSREMRDWMGIYREKVLERTDSGTWRNLPYPHILSATDSAEGFNLIKGIRPAFENYAERNHIQLHRDFAHLNSSQALAFNLFFPMLPTSESELKWGAPERISALLDQPLRKLKRAEFEKILNLEERTNLDWWGEFDDGGQLFCEVKFTESGFGKATSPSTDYRGRIERIYRPMLEGVIEPRLLDDLTWFKANYQILRNLAHLGVSNSSDLDRVLFVLPARSPAYGHLDDFLKRFLEPAIGHRVIVKDLESWTETLLASATSDEERLHWSELRKKYCPSLPWSEHEG